MASLVSGGKNNKSSKEVDIPRLSKNMEYIVHQEIVSRGMNPSLMKSNQFSHIIIKAVQDDEKMYLIAMAKRLQQCCPFLENHPSE
jgi:hypothetical protein